MARADPDVTDATMAISENLVKTTNIDNLSVASMACGSSVGNYAIFCAGNLESHNFSLKKVVDAYNDSLVHTRLGDREEDGWGMSTASLNNDYAIFAGGTKDNTESRDGPYTLRVFAYKKDLTRINLTSLTNGTLSDASASCPNFVLFITGYEPYAVEAFDKNLTHSQIYPSPLPDEYVFFGVSLNGAGIFFSYENAFVINSNLTKGATLAFNMMARGGIALGDFIIVGTQDSTNSYFVLNKSLVKISTFSANTVKYNYSVAAKINKSTALFMDKNKPSHVFNLE
jgi:hypothetical protein